jgi:pimeloyl-ACP methyl ester carboxylesterase
MHIEELGQANAPKPVLFWAHGWGQDHRAFAAIAPGLSATNRSLLADFPGFGKSPHPGAAWGTADYADAVAAVLKERNIGPVLYIGHSFGCRVGLQLAARHPDCVETLVLTAAAGLPAKRGLGTRIKRWFKVRAFKIAKIFVPEGPKRDRLRARFGSADYQSAGAMRDILVKTVSEDLSDVAAQIRCPVHLVFGNDTDTPPNIGERLHALIPGSTLAVLDGYDHYTILTDGRHQVTRIIADAAAAARKKAAAE